MEYYDDITSVLVELNEAIEEHEYLEDNAKVLKEGLYNTFSKSEMKRLKTITFAKLLDYTKKEIVDEIKEKDNGKKVEDYQLPEEDKHLTISKVKTFIIANGDTDAKDTIREKIANIDKIIAHSQSSKVDNFKVSYGTINSIYSLYKRVKKKALREETLLEIFNEAETEDLLEQQTYSDRKFALKHDPKEYVAKNTGPTVSEVYRWLSPLRRLFDTNISSDELLQKIHERGLQRVYKIEDHPELVTLVNQINSELEKDPINREKVKNLYCSFKKIYRESNIRKEVRDDEKIERRKAKMSTSSLYEGMTLGEFLEVKDE